MRLLSAQAEERRAVEFGVAADVVIGMRVQLPAVRVAPDFLGVVLAFEVDGASAPVVLLAGHVVPALEDQDPLARAGQRPGERAAARAGPDDRDVVAGRHS